MTLSSRISSLTGPDRAVEALRSEAVFWRWMFLGTGLALMFAAPALGSKVPAVAPLILLIAAKIAHLFALLAAALKARGL